MPIDKSRYPANWDEISRRIRFERAGNRCEWCRAPNGAWIVRSRTDHSRYIRYDSSEDRFYLQSGVMLRDNQMPADFDLSQGLTVVLTVHHRGIPKPDGTPGDRHDKMDCRDENLVALCQRCHWIADWDIHKFNQLEAKHQCRILAGQGELFALQAIRPK